METPPDRLPKDTPVPPVIRTFFASHQRIRAVLIEDVARKGLERDEFDVVVTLGGGKGMTCKAIAARVVAHNPTLTRTLKRMEEKGLVVWQPGPEDRRQKIVSLTPAGEAAFQRTHVPHMQLVTDSVNHLSPEEQADLDRLLRKLTAGFEAEGTLEGDGHG